MAATAPSAGAESALESVCRLDVDRDASRVVRPALSLLGGVRSLGIRCVLVVASLRMGEALRDVCVAGRV